MLKKITWTFFAVLCIGVGLYPVMYAFMGREYGILSSKSAELMSSLTWNIGFYSHITFGGIALLVGWSQFSKKFRATRMDLHRKVGKLYVFAALISGVMGFSVGFFATGGPIAKVGFISLGIFWIYVTWNAFAAIKQGDITRHERMMIYSYAACFGAVTLRIWLPLLIINLGDFIPAYRIVAWLAWVPNVIVAYFINQRIQQSRIPLKSQS